MGRVLAIKTFCLLACIGLALAPALALAVSRVVDLVDVESVSGDHLIGYGFVIGLHGTGDSLKNAPFTREELEAELKR